MPAPPPTRPIDGPEDSRSDRTAYRVYFVCVIIAVSTCASLDRGMLSVIMEPVRAEFHLTDTQLGWVVGIAFSLAYAIAGIPVGMLADRMSRRNLLATMLGLWSLMTAAAGLTANYMGLLASRVGLGATEAGTTAMGLSLISDTVPPRYRAMGLGSYYSGAGFGMLLSFAMGGFIAQHFGWRAALISAGIPGFFIVALLLMSTREPRRGRFDETPPAKAPPPGEVFREILTKPRLLGAMLAVLAATSTLEPLQTWIVALLIRIHHVPIATAGLISACSIGPMTIVGSICGGWVVDRWRHKVRPMIFIAIFIAAAALSAVGALYGTNLWIIGACLGGYALLFHAFWGPSYGVIIGEAPLAMRTSVLGVMVVVSMLISWGGSTLVVGALSDAYGGGPALREAIATVLVGSLVAITLYLAMDRGNARAATKAAKTVNGAVKVDVTAR